MLKKPVHIETISELHQLADFPPPEHPLLAIGRIEAIGTLPPTFPIAAHSYGFYSIGFKKNLTGYVKYGRRFYDFQEGVMGFTSPGQVLSYDSPDVSARAIGWMLFFHRTFLAGHTLAEQIENYGFFNYAVDEGLHLSSKEEETMNNIFENIYTEYTLPIDKYSKQVVLSNLELLLTYSNRYYGRQFITRNEVESSFLAEFEQYLKNYLSSGLLEAKGIPSVDYFASQLHVSPNYLSDKLRALTGKSTKEHIHFQILERAKNSLKHSDLSIAEVAYQLGFDYPQYFSRLFKQKVGMSPKEFRLSG